MTDVRIVCGYERANGKACGSFVREQGARCNTHSEENLRAIAEAAIAAEAKMLPRIGELELEIQDRKLALVQAEHAMSRLRDERSKLEAEIGNLRKYADQSPQLGRIAALLARAEELVLAIDATPDQVALADSRRELAKELRLFSTFAANVGSAAPKSRPATFEFDYPAKKKRAARRIDDHSRSLL
jgi:hypothetical protein